MWTFSKEFLFSCLRDFRAYFGVVGVIIGGIAAVIGTPIILPTYAWFLIAFVAVASMAVRSEWRAFQAKNTEIKCDMALLDALRQITGLDEIELRLADKQLRVDAALVQLSENACHGRITIWGRHGTIPEDYKKRPRTEIGPEYWETAIISYKGFLSNQEGCTITNSGSVLRTYSDLYFSRAQIDKIWPVRKKVMTLQWPFIIKLRSIIAPTSTSPEP
jgi:hypothetical protein